MKHPARSSSVSLVLSVSFLLLLALVALTGSASAAPRNMLPPPA